MVKLLQAFFTLLSTVASYFKDKQLMDAGEAKAGVKHYEQVEQNVAKAEQAVATPDPVRDERLRNKYDRSRRK